jgi:hypothetical protein
VARPKVRSPDEAAKRRLPLEPDENAWFRDLKESFERLFWLGGVGKKAAALIVGLSVLLLAIKGIAGFFTGGAP